MAEERKSTWEQRQDRATVRDAVPAVVALVVTEAIAAFTDLDAGSNPWHVLVAVLPLLAFVWLVWVQLRTLRRCDEYQRTLHLEAMSIGFAVAMLVAMAGATLGAADIGSDRQFLQLTFIAGILSWVGALAVRLRR
jgi:hypothetical protein